MKQVLKENESILNIIGKAKESASGYRLSHYTAVEEIDDGFLLYNTLTCGMVLLTPEEYEHVLDSQELRRKWYVVPNALEEKKIVNMVRWLQKTMNKEREGITNFIVYTTTDCNARCFYCFELGRKRIPMDDKTANKTADFIIKNHNGSPITINWFGGEPLFNTSAMDIICHRLKDAGISYTTSTTSNGYLFNDENVSKCIDLWNLNRVQISMDGTEAVYNKAKRYIYKEGNPFQIVMDNIQRLLDRGICVAVRVNMDFHNIEDLHVFTEDLARRFGSYRKFFMYAHLIIDETKEWYEHHSLEEWTTLYEEKARLEKKMLDLGIYSKRSPRLAKKPPMIACMAENSNSIVIAPDGRLGVCEHYSETEIIGHLDSPERDQTVINSFRQHWEDIPECDTCVWYPQCVRLKKCPYTMACIQPERKDTIDNLAAAMRYEYRRWLENIQEDDNFEPEEVD